MLPPTPHEAGDSALRGERIGMMKEQLYPVPTMAQKLACLIGAKSGPNSVFRCLGEPNADISIKYNRGVYVGMLASGLLSKSIGFITWRDIPLVVIGRFRYWVWKRSRDKARGSI